MYLPSVSQSIPLKSPDGGFYHSPWKRISEGEKIPYELNTRNSTNMRAAMLVFSDLGPAETGINSLHSSLHQPSFILRAKMFVLVEKSPLAHSMVLIS